MTTLTCCHGDVVIDAGPTSIKACYARSAMLTYCHGDLLCLHTFPWLSQNWYMYDIFLFLISSVD